ncbi:MAG: hypothetical protein CVU06_05695 [Bacteroidetes bacterium HGW-Bacteroidetes-22]|nr:MAG: hypothetical protein CVU06_05695 [Bacteroidetes bacterium HGW-Bacteroidetes-22]
MIAAENQSYPYRMVTHTLGIIPGIAKVMVFYREQAELRYCMASDGEAPCDETCSGNLLQQIHLHFKSKTPWEWLSVDDLPYEINTRSLIQRTVFSEENNRILLLRLNFEERNKNLLIYIHFPEHFNWTGKDRQQKELTTEHKSLISFLLYHQLFKTAGEYLTFDKTQHTIAQSFKTLGKQVSGINAGIDEANEKLNRWKAEIIRHFADEIAATAGITVAIDISALNALLKLDICPAELKRLINRSIAIASVTAAPTDPDIILYDWHLMALSASEKSEKAGEIIAEKITDRTTALLDRFELAARRVIDARESLTGQNLGKACIPSISAPAISDALKKHRDRIILLLKRYPDRWVLLRTHFKPVQNQLLSRNTENKSQSA